MNKFDVYNHPDNCPAERYFKVMETGDIRHLLKLDDYVNLPIPTIIDKVKGKVKRKIFKKTIEVPIYSFGNEKLGKAWAAINNHIGGGLLELSPERDKTELYKEFFNYVSTENSKRYNKLFADYIMALDGAYKNPKLTAQSIMRLAKYDIAVTHKQEISILAKYIDHTFKSFGSFIDTMRKKYDDYYTMLDIQLFLVECLEYEEKNTYSFHLELGKLESILNKSINQDVSLSMFLVYKKQAKEVIKRHEAKKNKSR